MKIKLLLFAITIAIISCNSDRSGEDHRNSGNGSMESPINGIPPGEPDSLPKDHMRVDQDTVHP